MLLSFGPWIVFLIAMLIRLLHNFSNGSLPQFACDGYEYISVAQSLYKFIAGSSTGLPTLAGLHDSGPVFPLFIVISYAIFGLSPSTAQVLPILITQSFISSLTCVFIFFIGNICWDRRTGLIAGLIAAFYPAFVVNSGRLYAETLAIFLLTAMLLLVCYLVKDNSQRLITIAAVGVIAALLQLTRSAMFGLSILAPIFILFGSWINSRRSTATMLKPIAAYLIGFMLVILPWMGFSKLAFGSASALVDRHGHYNLYIGNNVDTLGWLSEPNPPLIGIERAGFLQIMRCAIRKSPARWCALLEDKVLRLFKFPCNDFRTPIGPFNFFVQTLFHQLLLLLAAIGIGAMFLARSNQKQFTCQLLLLTVLCWHLIYILFIAMARYGLTAMPIVILLAASGCLLIRTRRFWILAASIALLVTAWAVLFPARANGRPHEIQKRIKQLNVTFPIKTLSSGNYLLIDSNGLVGVQHMVVKVNGQQLKGLFVPALSLLGDLSTFNIQDPNYIYLECGFIFASLTGPSHISNTDLRQWFLIPLPDDLVKRSQNLKVSIEGGGVPINFYEQQSTDNHVVMPSPYKCSWEKAFFGVEDAGSFSDPRYDFELPCTEAVVPDLLLLSCPKGILLLPIPAQITSTNDGLLIQTKNVPEYHKDDFWIVRFSGTTSAAQLMPQISVTSKTNQQFNYNPPWLPRTVGTSFDLAFPLIPSGLPGKLESITLHLNDAQAQMKNCAIEIYKTQKNPLCSPNDIRVPQIINQG